MAQLLNLPGLNTAQAALMASAAAGKPLANAMAMAMLQQQQQQQREQQQQQQQQQQAAMMAATMLASASSSNPAAALAAAAASAGGGSPTTPRRGRGSRGGSLGRPRGSSLANKLKKLDS